MCILQCRELGPPGDPVWPLLGGLWVNGGLLTLEQHRKHSRKSGMNQLGQAEAMAKFQLELWVNYYKPDFGFDSYQLDSEI